MTSGFGNDLGKMDFWMCDFQFHVRQKYMKCRFIQCLCYPGLFVAEISYTLLILMCLLVYSYLLSGATAAGRRCTPAPSLLGTSASISLSSPELDHSSLASPAAGAALRDASTPGSSASLIHALKASVWNTVVDFPGDAKVSSSSQRVNASSHTTRFSYIASHSASTRAVSGESLEHPAAETNF